MKISNWLSEQEIAAIASFPESKDTQLFRDLTTKMTSTLINILDSFMGESTKTFTPTKTYRQWLKENGRTCQLVSLTKAVASRDVNMVNILDMLDESCHCAAPCPCA